MKEIYLTYLLLLISNALPAQTDNSNCIEFLTLGNSEGRVNYIYNVQKKIFVENNYTLQVGNGKIVMKAGEEIVLKPNSHIALDSDYHALIRDCEVCHNKFTFSNFFTPNQDAFNDFWSVEWLDSEKFIGVSIFDRYGKLIKTFTSPTDTWNGTYNNNQMPSSDYWFKITYLDCDNKQKDYYSHFTLKR